MQIKVKTTTRLRPVFHLDVDLSDTGDHVLDLVGAKMRVPPGTLRLLGGDDYGRIACGTLGQHGVEDGDELDVVFEQVGMISTFTSSDTTDPLVSYLMLTDQERESAPIPLVELRRKAMREEVKRFTTFNYDENCNMLSRSQRDLLCDFLDFIWSTESQTGDASNRSDMRLVVDEDIFLAILGTIDHRNERNQSARSALDSLHFNFGQVPGVHENTSPKIALRMTRGPTRSCIAFHCDGGYATSTTQIPLNSPDEYEGGKLCFFVNDKLHFVPRVAGSMVQHPPNILHGVTSVTRGTRKSLFVVDDSNHLGMEGVIKVTSNHVVTCLASRA